MKMALKDNAMRTWEDRPHHARLVLMADIGLISQPGLVVSRQGAAGWSDFTDLAPSVAMHISAWSSNYLITSRPCLFDLVLQNRAVISSRCLEKSSVYMHIFILHNIKNNIRINARTHHLVDLIYNPDDTNSHISFYRTFIRTWPPFF